MTPNKDRHPILSLAGCQFLGFSHYNGVFFDKIYSKKPAFNKGFLAKKTVCHIKKAPDPAGYDLVVIGFWLQAGKPDPLSAEYLAGLGDVKLFLVATHGAAADSAHAQNGMAQAKSLAASARIAGTFNCQGEVNPALLDKVRKKDPQPPWIGDAPGAIGHPDATDIEQLTKAIKTGLPEFLL